MAICPRSYKNTYTLGLLLMWGCVSSLRVTCIIAISLDTRGHNSASHYLFSSWPIRRPIASGKNMPRVHLPRVTLQLTNQNCHCVRRNCATCSRPTCPYKFCRFVSNTWPRSQLCLAACYSKTEQQNKFTVMNCCKWDESSVQYNDCILLSTLHYENYTYHRSICISRYDKCTKRNTASVLYV